MSKDVIAKEEVENLSFFDKFQDKVISTKDAEEIKNKQQEIITSSFTDGFEKIIPVPNTENFAIASELIAYFCKVDQGDFLRHPEMFREQQEKLYCSVHRSNLHSTHKIFYEYLIGLSRFVLSIQLIHEYVKYLNNDQYPEDILVHAKELFFEDEDYSLITYLNRLLIISNIGKLLISHLSEQYFQRGFSTEKYWDDVEQYLLSFPKLDLMAKNLVSIQYIPENKRYLAMMQSIHWQGFGGSGDLLLNFERLRGLVTHSISHHDNYKTYNLFNQRLLAFKSPLETMLSMTQNLIIEHLENYFPNEVINIHDFCSGPRFIAVRAIIEKEKNRKFNLTVSDIDGASLISLLSEREKKDFANINQYEVRYEDLCLPLKISKDQMNKYHLVSVNLGLHQMPIEEIYAAIRYFTEITKTGGLIANLDASERRYLQLFVIPGNLVDREGYVPYVEEMDLRHLIVPSHYKDYFRIAYPLPRLSEKILRNLDPKIGVGPYMNAFYTPMFVKKQNFNVLCELWSLKKYTECDDLVHQQV